MSAGRHYAVSVTAKKNTMNWKHVWFVSVGYVRTALRISGNSRLDIFAKIVKLEGVKVNRIIVDKRYLIMSLLDILLMGGVYVGSKVLSSDSPRNYFKDSEGHLTAEKLRSDLCNDLQDARRKNEKLLRECERYKQVFQKYDNKTLIKMYRELSGKRKLACLLLLKERQKSQDDEAYFLNNYNDFGDDEITWDEFSFDDFPDQSDPDLESDYIDYEPKTALVARGERKKSIDLDLAISAEEESLMSDSYFGTRTPEEWELNIKPLGLLKEVIPQDELRVVGILFLEIPQSEIIILRVTNLREGILGEVKKLKLLEERQSRNPMEDKIKKNWQSIGAFALPIGTSNDAVLITKNLERYFTDKLSKVKE